MIMQSLASCVRFSSPCPVQAPSGDVNQVHTAGLKIGPLIAMRSTIFMSFKVGCLKVVNSILSVLICDSIVQAEQEIQH
jgi:hypothetical protein